MLKLIHETYNLSKSILSKVIKNYYLQADSFRYILSLDYKIHVTPSVFENLCKHDRNLDLIKHILSLKDRKEIYPHHKSCLGLNVSIASESFEIVKYLCSLPKMNNKITKKLILYAFKFSSFEIALHLYKESKLYHLYIDDIQVFIKILERSRNKPSYDMMTWILQKRNRYVTALLNMCIFSQRSVINQYGIEQEYRNDRWCGGKINYGRGEMITFRRFHVLKRRKEREISKS